LGLSCSTLTSPFTPNVEVAVAKAIAYGSA